MGSHNHEYHGCQHNLKHCTHCDVVYCTKCSKDWGNQITLIERYREQFPKYPKEIWMQLEKSADNIMLCSNKHE